MTLSELMAQAAGRLAAAQQAGQLAFGHGTSNARDEAAWLLLWKLGLPLDCDLDAEGARAVSVDEARDVLALIDERISTDGMVRGVRTYVRLFRTL